MKSEGKQKKILKLTNSFGINKIVYIHPKNGFVLQNSVNDPRTGQTNS